MFQPVEGNPFKYGGSLFNTTQVTKVASETADLNFNTTTVISSKRENETKKKQCTLSLKAAIAV